MGPFTVSSRVVQNMGRNFAFNLGYLPADKLDWKPAPTAKSALEIVNHTAYFLTGMASAVAGGWVEPKYEPAGDLQSAQALITESANRYAAALEGVRPEDLQRKVDLPFGSFPLAQAASMAMVDLLHHHGQLAYIQTLLGDTEDHFDPAIMQAD
jgi:hypothetical protein